MKEFIVILIAFCITFIILSVIGTSIFLIDKFIACPQFAKSVDLPYRYNFWAGGCFVQFNGQWIRSGNFGGVQIKGQ